jgi:hypothetical protein
MSWEKFIEEVLPVDSVEDYFQHFHFLGIVIPSSVLLLSSDEPLSQSIILRIIVREIIFVK